MDTRDCGRCGFCEGEWTLAIAGVVDFASGNGPHPRPFGHPLSINGDGERHLPAADVIDLAMGRDICLRQM